jgi:hypothetical protein
MLLDGISVQLTSLLSGDILKKEKLSVFMAGEKEVFYGLI